MKIHGWLAGAALFLSGTHARAQTIDCRLGVTSPDLARVSEVERESLRKRSYDFVSAPGGLASIVVEVRAEKRRETVREYGQYVIRTRIHYVALAHHRELSLLDLGELRPVENEESAPVDYAELYEIALDRLPDCEAFYRSDRSGSTWKDAIDDFRYRMTVEWDQRDLARQAEIIGIFDHRIDAELGASSASEVLRRTSELVASPEAKRDLILYSNYAASRVPKLATIRGWIREAVLRQP